MAQWVADTGSWFSSVWSIQLIMTWTVLSSGSIWSVGAQDSICQQLEPSPSLEQFVDELTQPPVINVSRASLSRRGRATVTTVGMYKINQTLHRDLPQTTLYAYGTSQQTASSPGPTLVATRRNWSRIKWENHIEDLQHFLPIDPTLMWANPANGGVPTVVHLHGAEVASVSDGNPQAWYTASGETGPNFTTWNYTYPNTQPATLLFYHDHTLGITRLNALAGLSGMYVIRDPDNEPVGLPTGEFEKFLQIQDKSFHANGSINFPTIGNAPDVHPSWCPEYYGDVILVNGKAWPFLNVIPTVYRFRMVNVANARFFTLTLDHPNVTLTQIATDGGYLPSPVNRTSLTFGPGERTDFTIDFSLLQPGEFVTLNNSGNELSPTTTAVMRFNVVQSNKPLTTVALPSVLSTAVNISTWSATSLTRRMYLTMVFDDSGNRIAALLNGLRWTDPVTETPQLNTTEVWEIINLTDDGHTIHIHLIHFIVTSLQTLDFKRYLNQDCTFDVAYPDPTSCYTGQAQAPRAYHEGWKDTVSIFPGQALTLAVRWSSQSNEPYTFDATAGPGYAWHCHVLDHEDNEMMRPLLVTPAAYTATVAT